MKWGRKVDPNQWKEVPKLADFEEKWFEWWVDLQPEERGGRWPLSREFDTSKEDVWVRTAKGSMHGSYVLALSMAMWRQLYREDDSMEDFNKAFDDVVWVLDHSLAALRSGTAGAGSKRKAGETQTTRGKR